MSTISALILSISLFISQISFTSVPAANNTLNLVSESAILMEASTGTIIYEKNANEQFRPASITKIMTLLLIFDALAEKKLTLDDTVTVSEYASGMGGSQVYLEPGETQTVDTMIKCISVASANDACVSMAEHLCGSETEFVNRMNERAKGLGMSNTNFVNCCGLDVDGHVTTAHDISLMSRELITKYPQIFEYSTIWMDNITHVTRRGTSEFGLTNTNKLIRQYAYATGLKTGFTNLAKFCVSATAKKDNMELIAVIMAAPDSKTRFAEATSLLNYGFSVCQIYEDKNDAPLSPMNIEKGTSDTVPLCYKEPFHYVVTDGSSLSDIEKKIELPELVTAPVKKGTAAGRAVYLLNGKELGSVEILYETTVEAAKFKDYFFRVLDKYSLL